MKTFSNRSNATRDARKHLGTSAAPGIDFHIVPAPGGRFGWAAGSAEQPAAPEPAAKAPRKPAPAPAAKAPRETKALRATSLMRRPGGVTGPELQAELGWQPHTVRGFISGYVRKKLGLEVSAAREEAGTRYRIAS